MCAEPHKVGRKRKKSLTNSPIFNAHFTTEKKRERKKNLPKEFNRLSARCKLSQCTAAKHICALYAKKLGNSVNHTQQQQQQQQRQQHLQLPNYTYSSVSHTTTVCLPINTTLFWQKKKKKRSTRVLKSSKPELLLSAFSQSKLAKLAELQKNGSYGSLIKPVHSPFTITLLL